MNSKRLYRLLADHSSDMIVLYGLDLVRHYVSPACFSMLGYKPEELLGRSPLDDIHPEDRTHVQEVFLAGRTSPLAASIDYRQKHKDGRYVWLEATYRFLHNRRTSAVEQYIATVRDISQRKAAEDAAASAALRANESLRLLVMAEGLANVGHWRLDTRTNRFFWSSEIYRIYGLQPNEEAPTIDEALSAYHHDDQSMVFDLMRQTRKTGTAFDFAARIVRPDGDVRHVVSRGQVEKGPNGAVTAVFGVLQDVTRQAQAEAALREGEARYRLLAENATDIIFRLGRDGRFIYVSPAVETLTGFPPEARIGIEALSAIHTDDHSRVVRALQDLWSGRAELAVVSYRARCANGDWRWLEASGRLVVNDGDSEIVGVSRDISARKQFEADLSKAREVAEAAAREARHLAETDDLTGLANRRMFMRELDACVSSAAENRLPLSLGIFDIDHFKRVNDRYGHGMGDLVLERVARVAAQAGRQHGLVGRLGGEEFGVLMCACDAKVAVAAAERIRMAVETCASEDTDIPCVTISVGVATFRASMTASSLLAAADAALYEAKRAGRNKICSIDPITRTHSYQIDAETSEFDDVATI